MFTNKELIEKAITAAESLASYGKLNPKQADMFLDWVIDESVLRNNVRIERFRNEKMQIDKIGIADRVMFPAVEYQAPQHRLGVTTSQIELQPKEVICAFDISKSFSEVNIEGDAIEDHIMRMFAAGWRNNTEQLAIGGDTVGEAAIEGNIKPGGSTTQYILDSLMAMFDGWWRKADAGHIVDAGNTNIGLSVFSQMIRALPTKFRRNKADLRFFMPSDLVQIYIEKLATRQTGLGDNSAKGVLQSPFSIPIVEVPLLDLHPTVVEHVTLTGTTPVALRYAPIVAGSEVVTLTTLDQTPTTPYIEGTDYDMDYNAGTIARNSGGSLGTPVDVKVTYQAGGSQIILTHYKNFILAFGRDDMTIGRATNIHKRANEYVMTGKFDVQIEETDALVKAYNVGTAV